MTPESLSPREIEALKMEFLTPKEKDYKNPALFALEPEYLKTPEFDRTKLTPHQFRRKVGELALRLGKEFREKNPDPGRRDPAIGVRLLKEIVGDIPELNEPLILYEDDPTQPTQITPAEGFEDLEVTPLQENALQVIEEDGKNLRRKTERRVLENGVLPTDDQSRIREIVLKRKDGTEMPLVSKRVDRRKVREEMVEEFRLLERVRDENLPGPRPVARVEARGNQYILMTKGEGVGLKKLTDAQVQELSGKTNTEEERGRIVEAVERLKDRYAQSGIVREDWDEKDLLVSYDREQSQWVVTPIDFEKSKLRKT